MNSEILKKIRNAEALDESGITLAVTDILDGKWTASQTGAFLMGLSQRGETAEEITGAAKVLRNRAKIISAPYGAIDCCGTGGDHSNSLNISTAVAFVVAACGVPVAKHGNRAASSKSGAADVLEALNINLDLSIAACEKALTEIGFCFLMAPHHHSALKPLSALRKELGFRTIFNLLGPLANPADTKLQLLGVFDRSFVRPMAEALLSLGSRHALVVHGADGMDEITLAGETYYAHLEDGKINEGVLKPSDFGLDPITAEDIRGGDASYNATALVGLLEGEDTAYRRIVLANASAALLVSGKSAEIHSGVKLAEDAIDDGRALRLFEGYRSFTKEHGGHA
ncbi:MAG: anthranilate phosphoribosyltransferase [Pseudobdellovibrionaceae bacterium]|jgi:anthranilate phosphoribosyltransferase|nr:anthranilate phosphoribosyltransferase [Pseudobdellovibrionaceae bacterium]